MNRKMSEKAAKIVKVGKVVEKRARRGGEMFVWTDGGEKEGWQQGERWIECLCLWGLCQGPT